MTCAFGGYVLYSHHAENYRTYMLCIFSVVGLVEPSAGFDTFGNHDGNGASAKHLYLVSYRMSNPTSDGCSKLAAETPLGSGDRCNSVTAHGVLTPIPPKSKGEGDSSSSGLISEGEAKSQINLLLDYLSPDGLIWVRKVCKQKRKSLLSGLVRKKKQKPEKPKEVKPRVSTEQFVEHLKKNATSAEKKFKSMLEEWGIEFEFQKPIPIYPFFVMDFVIQRCGTEMPLIVEIDGKYHDNSKQMKRDSLRQNFLEAHSFGKVIRFTNEEISKQMGMVEKRIAAHHPKHIDKLST